MPECVLDALGGLFCDASAPEQARLEACAALENLSLSSEGCDAVSRMGRVLDTAVSLLVSGSHKASEGSLGLIQNLAAVPNNRVHITQARGVLKGLANMLWTGSPKAVEDACATVGNLAASSEVSDAGPSHADMRQLALPQQKLGLSRQGLIVLP